MNSTYPCIKVCDIETSIDWYVDFLGFQCTYKSSLKNPDAAILEKGSLKVYLLRDESRETYASNILVVETKNIEEEYEVLDSAGVIFVQPIESGMFGQLEFVIKDYEDNKIVYIQQKT